MPGQIGAFCAFSLLSSRKAPRAGIHALEPFPSTLARLTQTIERNDHHAVKVSPIALGDANSGLVRHMSDEGPSQSRGTRVEPIPGRVAVQVSTVKQFLDDANIVDADFLKMDIGGAGFASLPLTSPNGSPAALFGKLTSCGFMCEHDARVGADFWSSRTELDATLGGPPEAGPSPTGRS